mgnify:CR=1 FL=1
MQCPYCLTHHQHFSQRLNLRIMIQMLILMIYKKSKFIVYSDLQFQYKILNTLVAHGSDVRNHM